jgi:hypothetical protein
VGGNFGIPDRDSAAYYGMDYGALPPSPQLGPNVGELQSAQRQAESQRLHDETYRQQFGGPVPSQVTPREYRDTMLDLFTPGGERTVMAPLTFLGGAAKALFSGAPPDPGSLEEHARQAAMLYGTQDIPGGGFSDAEVTARKAIEAEAGGVDVAGAGGEGGVGAAILNFMRGGDLTPEQIFQRSMSQRKHDREIAMQFGTGPIPGGGFSDAEEAAHKARQLDILHKARQRAAFTELGVDPIAPQSTLPPLPTGAEATFGPEYEMMAANALINTPIDATELLSPELRQKMESLRWPGAPGRYPANVQAGRQSLTDYAAGLSSLNIPKPQAGRQSLTDYAAGLSSLNIPKPLGPDNIPKPLGPEYTPPGFAGPIGDNPIFAPGGGVPPPPAAPARSLSRNEAMNTNLAIAYNNPELLSLATLGSINPLPPRIEVPQRWDTSGVGRRGTFDPPKQAAAPQAVGFPGGRLPGRSVAEPFGPPPQTPIYPPNVPAITTYGGFDPYDPSQNLPDMPAPSAPDAALDLDYWW